MKVDPTVTYTFAIQELHGTPKIPKSKIPLKQDQISTELNSTIFIPPKQTAGLIRSIFTLNSKGKVTKVEQKKKTDRQKTPPPCRAVQCPSKHVGIEVFSAQKPETKKPLGTSATWHTRGNGAVISTRMQELGHVTAHMGQRSPPREKRQRHWNPGGKIEKTARGKACW